MSEYVDNQFLYNKYMSKLVKAWYQFLHHQFGIQSRSAPSLKVRKYNQMQIQQQFLKFDENRKKQRFKLLEYRKSLLNKQIQNETKLISQNKHQNLELVENLKTQIQKIQNQLQQQKKQLKIIDQQIQSTQSQYIIVTGPQKLIIQNHIIYIKHMSTHPTGLILNPETIKVIQNIHYLLEHNLPIQKYKLYQLMPQLFKTQIFQLEQSAQRLLDQKRPIFQAKSQELINFYQRRTKFQPQQQMDILIQQRNQIIFSLNNKTNKILNKHNDFFKKVNSGQTRFRSLLHFYYECIDIDDQNNFTPQQLEVKKSILQVHNIKLDFQKYQDLYHQKLNKIKTQLLIPCYILGNPVLVQKFIQTHNQITEYMMPLKDSQFIPHTQQKPNYLQIKMREALQKQFSDSKLVGNYGDNRNKNESKVKLLNIITRVLQDFDEDGELIIEQKQNEQRFEKIQKNKDENSIFALPTKQILLQLDDLTKMIFLNNKEPKKYTIEFFSKYFGIESKLLQNVLNYISYPEVNQNGAKKILKFIV